MYKRVRREHTICMAFLVVGQKPCRMLLNWITGGEQAPGTDTLPLQQESADTVSDARMRETVLYYRYSDGYLAPVSVEIEWEEGIARAALERLISDDELSVMAQSTGLFSPVPAGTRVLGLTIRDGLAKVDLSQEALDCASAEEEELMIKSVVYTLTEFNTVDRVQFMFEGDVPRAFHTEPAPEAPYPGEYKQAGRHRGFQRHGIFPQGEREGLRILRAGYAGTGTAGSSMDVAIKCLLEGPPEGSGLQSAIPADVKINGMGTKTA